MCGQDAPVHQRGCNKYGQGSTAVQLMQVVGIYLSHVLVVVPHSISTLLQIQVVTLTWPVWATPSMLGTQANFS